MAKYTTQLRTILNNQDDYFELWDFDFPLFDMNYRDALINKINNHYYMREIGSETVGLFQHYLKTKMNEIMPRMNLLYKVKLEDIDPLITYRLNEKSKRTNAGTSTGQSASTASGNATADNVELYSDTPQGQVDLRRGKHLTTATDTSNKANSSNTSSGNSSQTVSNTEDYVRDLVGNTSGKSETELIVSYRDAIIDVDMMIIDELGELFMNIF